MNALRILNKEQWTVAATVAVCLYLILGGLAGGVSPKEDTDVSGPERGYKRPDLPPVEPVAEKYEVYGGPKIVIGQSASRLAVPYVRPPQPKAEELTAPAFRPGPASQVLNGLEVKTKYPVLSAGVPTVSAEALPPAGDIDALKVLEEPAIVLRKDRRHEKERELFKIVLKRNNITYEGRLLGRGPGGEYIVQVAKNKARVTVKPGDVKEVFTNDTWEIWYQKRSQGIKPGPTEAEKRTQLARSVFEKGMLPEAKAELALAIKAKEDHAPAIRLQGQIAFEHGDFNGAIAVYEAGIGEGSPGADLHYEIGRCHLAISFPEGAAAEFGKALDASPLHVEAKLGLARAQLLIGEPKKARATANDFLVKIGRLRSTDAKAKARGFLLRALGEIGQGRLGPARGDLTESLKLVSLPEAMNAVAALDALEGNMKEAATGFVRAVQADQYLIEAWTNLGAVLLLAGKWADAEAIYKGAAQRDPASVEAVVGQGIAKVMAGSADAEQVVGQALQMNPKHAQAHVVMGLLKLRGGATTEALAHYKSTLQSDYYYLPAYAGAAASWLAAARAADESGDPAKQAEVEQLRISASTLLEVMKSYDPTNPGTLTALGCAYAAMRRPEAARQELREAISARETAKQSPDPLIFYALGFLDYHHGPGETEEARLMGARRTFQQAIGLKGKVTDPVGQAIIKECELISAAIEEWRNTAVRLDDGFDRPSSTNVGGGWVETEGQYGLDIVVENFPNTGGRVKFFGTQAIKDFGTTTMARDIPPRDFYAMEASFFPVKSKDVEYGLSVLTDAQGQSRIGFHLAVDPNGRLKYKPRGSDPGDMDGRDTSIGWNPVKIPPPDGKEITIRILRTVKNRRSLFTLLLWDKANGAWVEAQKTIPIHAPDPPKTNWVVKLWARAIRGAEVEVYMDNIRVFERNDN